MTTELEEQFFRVFGVEPTVYSVWDSKETQIKNFKSFTVYPAITDRKLLEMICIILDAEGLLTINTEGNIADIKDFVLRFLIGKVNKNNLYCHYKTKNKIKHQIQQLFMGGEWTEH